MASAAMESPAVIRKLIAQEYAKYGLMAASIIGLAVAAGSKPEEDPRSSAFGKIKVGSTYIDLFSGLQQPLVFMSRIVTGQRKTQQGTIRQERGEDTAFGASTTRTIGQFIRSKLAPIPGAALTLITGKDYIGEEKKPWEILADLPIPLVLKDTYEAMRVEGVPAGVALGFVAMMGEGVSTQQERSLKELGRGATKPERRKQFGVALRSVKNNIIRGKLDIRRQYKDNPEKIREETKKLIKSQVERRKHLRKIFLGM